MKTPERIRLLLLFNLLYSAVCLTQSIDYQLLNRGIEWKNRGNYEQSIQTFSKFIDQHPTDNKIAYYHRAYAYYYHKDYDSAISDFEKFNELDSRNFEGPRGLGLAYFKKGEYDIATAYFTKAIELSPNSAMPYNERGMVRCYQRQFSTALEDFYKATKLDPTYALAHNNTGAARYYNQNIAKPSVRDIEIARSWFNKALQYKPEFLLALRNRAAMSIFLKDYELALNDLEKAKEIAPDDGMIYFYFGVAYADMELSSKAISSFKRSLQLLPNLPFAYEEMGNLHKSLGDHQSAVYNYTKAQEVRGDDTSVYAALMDYRIALVYAGQENYDQMYEYLKKARKKDVFKDMQIYRDFQAANEFDKLRWNKEFQKFTRSISKGEKENKFLNPELGWFRIRK